MNPVAPLISAVMAVYNGEEFLAQTLESIISQTFEPFELIVIDDASTDSTPSILKSFAERDGRIKIFRNAENLRLAASLNKGIDLAEGKYILRIDADDICLPERFAAQYRYMEENPEVDLSFCRFFSLRNGEIMPCLLGRRLGNDGIRAMLLFFCPVLHPGVIVKSEVMKKYSYDPLHTCSEDIDLWLRMTVDGVNITCCGDYLMLYRIHDKSVTAKSEEKQGREVLLSEKRFYGAVLSGIPQSQEDFYINGIYFRRSPDIRRLYSFYRYIIKENRKKRQFSENAVISAAAEILAEYNRSGRMSFADKLYMLRFGGIRLIAEILRKKLQSHRDLKLACGAAERAGFKIKGYNGILPIYYLEN